MILIFELICFFSTNDLFQFGNIIKCFFSDIDRERKYIHSDHRKLCKYYIMYIMQICNNKNNYWYNCNINSKKKIDYVLLKFLVIFLHYYLTKKKFKKESIYMSK